VLLVEAGEASSAAITVRNELYMWGVGLHGRLGSGKTANVLRPAVVEDLKDLKVEDVALGTSHALCVLRNGKGMCWGSSSNGKGMCWGSSSNGKGMCWGSSKDGKLGYEELRGSVQIPPQNPQRPHFPKENRSKRQA